ncbi:MAG: DegT/DnrJ/EryC1/StrS family aminotransferase [Acidimicrobiia bacterium]
MTNDLSTVPFLDVGASYRELRGEIDAALHRVLESGWFILGPEVDAFEDEYAEFVGARHCVGVASGLDALRLALSALDVGPGDEVIVPANTYIATWYAVTLVGAVVVPVEPDDRTYNLAPDGIEAAITERTKVVIPVHLYGQPADLTPIRAIARSHRLRIIEDAAQAHGASYEGQRVGAGSDIVAWSFYPGKNLGAFGDGGAVTTDDPEVADRVGRLRNYGSSAKYVNEEVGLNSRLDPMQAAVLRVKLQHLDAWNDRREVVANRYLAELPESVLRLPHTHEQARSVWHLFVVRTPERAALKRHLEAGGVQTGIHYPIPPHLQRAYESLGFGPGSFPITEAIHAQALSLPMGPHLSADDQTRVVQAIAEWKH